MSQRENCRFPYILSYFIIGFLAGILTLILRSRRELAAISASEPPAALSKRPAKAIVLPDTMPTGALPSPDDLTIIEGIGPKVDTVLRNSGIRTLKQLAKSSPEQLKKLLVAAGNRISNPETWPAQAALAASGKLDELKTMQDGLKAGRKS